MEIKNAGNRREARRLLGMPVTFFLNEKKGSMSDYLFGCTKDVSSRGVSIYCRPNHIPRVASLVTLLVTPEEKNRFSHTDIPVYIKGQVVWSDRDQQIFGIRFT
jgi:hypothetical protein